MADQRATRGAIITDPATSTQQATVTARGSLLAEGDVAHDSVDAGSPIKIGGKANALSAPAVAESDRVDASFDLEGKLRTNQGNFISTTSFNSRAAATLAAAATFQGVGEDVRAYGRVGVSIVSDNATDGTLTMEVSHDNATWGGPDRTWSDTRFAAPHMWNIVEPYFRIKYVNGTTEATNLAITVQYSNNADVLLGHQLNETLLDETEALIVRAVGVGESPDGVYANTLADGLGFSTAALLGNGVTYDSTVLSLVGYTQVQTAVLSDVDGTIVIDFIRDSAGTDIIRTLTIPFVAADGFQLFGAPAFTPYVRYRFTADAAGQTDFYFDTKFTTKALSGQVLRLDAFLSDSMVANVGRSVLVGKTGGGSYVNVGVSAGGTLKTDLEEIAGTAVSVNAGNVDAGTLRVTLATDQLTVPVDGNVAHDAADAGDPIKIGGKASATEPAVVAGADRVNAWFDLVGRLVTAPQHPAAVAVTGSHGPHTQNVTASGDTTLVAAPGAGLSIHVTGFWLSNTSTTAIITAFLRDGTTPRYGGALNKNGGGVIRDLQIPWKLAANALLACNLSGAGTVTVNVDYFVAA